MATTKASFGIVPVRGRRFAHSGLSGMEVNADTVRLSDVHWRVGTNARLLSHRARA